VGKKLLKLKIIERSATFFFKPFEITGDAIVTPIQYFLAWRLPHQHYTGRYDGRHTTFLNTM
jgi:hypothetical protein